MAIIRVRTRPEAPTRQPATISAVLVMIIPASAAAIPDNELSKDMTTGISPPPIGKTNARPVISEAIKKQTKIILIKSISSISKPDTLRTICRMHSSANEHPKINIHLEAELTKLLVFFKTSDNLKNAIKLPEKVIPPIMTIVRRRPMVLNPPANENAERGQGDAGLAGFVVGFFKSFNN